MAGPATPSDGAPTATTPQGKRGPKKIDVIGDQSDGKKLAADLPAAIGIPEEAQAWTKVSSMTWWQLSALWELFNTWPSSSHSPASMHMCCNADATCNSCSPHAQVYGESIVRNFHSSDWKDREQSLASIQRSLGTSKFLAGKDPNTVYSVTAEMLAKTLKCVARLLAARTMQLHALLTSMNTWACQPCPLPAAHTASSLS